MQWDTEQDTFSFRTIRNVTANTRRSILYVMSSLYDPLGLAAAMILHAKRLLQKLSREDLDWDDLIVVITWYDGVSGLEVSLAYLM